MTWFTIALIPPFLWAISNMVDRYISSNKNINIWESLTIINTAKIPFLVVFGCAILWKGVSLSWDGVLWGCLLGVLYTFAVLLYLMVLQKEEASIALPLYEIGPIWSLILGFMILGEIPSAYALGGIGIISIGGLILSREKRGIDGIKKSIVKIFFIILVSSLLFNITYVLFKYAHRNISLEELFFFQYIFQILSSVILGLFMNRIKYKKGFPEGSKLIWGLSVFGESVGIFGTFLIMFAYIGGPVGVVSALSSTQMIWVLVMSFLLSHFYPKHFSEKWDSYNRYKKIFGVCIIFCGVLLLGKGEL